MSSGRGGTSRGRARGGGQRQERSRGGGRISTALPEVARLPDDVLEIMDQERSSRESIEDLVIDPETGNITALSFPSVPEPGRATRDLLDSPHGAPRFWGSPEWNSIPRFVILTGRNGAGKSQLLDRINGLLKESRQILYLRADQNLAKDTSRANTVLDSSDILKPEEVARLVNNFNDPRFVISLRHMSTDSQYLIYQHLPLKEEGELYTEEDVEEAISKTKFLNYSKLDLDKPFHFLRIVFEEYEKRRAAFASPRDDYGTLYKYFQFQQENPIDDSRPIGAEDFMRMFAEDRDFRERMADHYAQKFVGRKPWEEINEVLERRGFKYRIDFRNNKIKLIRNIGGRDISISDRELSSGETTILSVLSWQYYGVINSAMREDGVDRTKVKIILLDEFDKHLDPELIKQCLKILQEEFVERQNTQVIMTTHRIDTVALSPEGSLFSIEANHEDKQVVVPISQIQGMFRLTPNLREISNIRTRVYTEAHDDAEFMEGIYQAILRFSSQAREYNQKFARDAGSKTSMTWEVAEARLMSRRYPMTFTSAAYSKGTGGSCHKVEELVNRDLSQRQVHVGMLERESELGMASHERRFHVSILEITKPFGLLDKDYERFEFKAHAVATRERESYLARFTKLNRHSLENFVFDPFIVATVGRVELMAEPFKKICTELRTAITERNIEQIQKQVDEYCESILRGAQVTKRTAMRSGVEKERWSFGGAGPEEAQAIALRLIDVIIEKTDECFALKIPYDRDKHFALLTRTEERDYRMYSEVYLDTGIEPRKPRVTPADKAQFETLCDIVKPERYFQQCALKSGERRRIPIKVMLSHDCVVDITYPELFLFIRGHDFERAIGTTGGVSKKDFQKELISRAALATAIPMDLARTFFELNEKIRIQGKSAITLSVIVDDEAGLGGEAALPRTDRVEVAADVSGASASSSLRPDPRRSGDDDHAARFLAKKAEASQEASAVRE